MRYNKKATFFVAAYITGLLVLACVGYFYADYQIQIDHRHKAEEQRFRSDVAYVSLPRMNLTLGSSDGHKIGRVRLDVSLAVEKKYLEKIQGAEPRIADRLVGYLQNVDFDELSQPKSTIWLHRRLLQEAAAASAPLPIMDIIFQQFVIL
jgi:flagellar basal body-associated protein FliL